MEIHAQVTSRAKLFSGASAEYGGEPNNHVSLVDAAMPGMLPVINEECVAQAVEMESDDACEKAIQALNGQEVDGRAITVNEARERSPRPGGGGGGGRGGYGGGRGGYGRD